MRYNIIVRRFTQYSKPVFLKANLSHFVKFTSRKMSLDVEALEKSKSMLKSMYFAGVNAVSPKTLTINKVKFNNGILQVGDESIELTKNVYLIGFGKAVMGMAIVLEHMLGDYLKKGIVSVPSASTNEMWEAKDKTYFPKLGTSVVQYIEGGTNNQPDVTTLDTTHQIIDLVEPLTEQDTLIVLISGGGSALLYMPRPAIDCDDKLHVCKMLQNAGADIKEVNIVRQKLSMVKGGGLARMAYPANIISLIMSDIVGDPIDLIASGPTVYSQKRPKDVIAVLKKYNLFDQLEGDVKKLIISKEKFKDKQLLVPRKKIFKHVTNIILGNNAIAIDAASAEAYRHKITPIVLRFDAVGDVHDVSLAYVHVTSLILLALDKAIEKEEFFERVKDIPVLSLSAPKVDEIYNLIDTVSEEGLVLIGGGEPTVVVKGKGKGGRNQELATYFSLDWLAKIQSSPRFAEYEVIMLSAGTDGQDGPTDAAGAFGYPAIGPMIHDLYAKVKSFASKVIVEAREKKEAARKEKEEIEEFCRKRQPPKEICKTQVLSGYISSKNTEGQNETQIEENSLAADVDMENVIPFILRVMEVERMLPENALEENDTYNLYSRFKKGSDLFKTGFTGTNVMDLHFIFIKKRQCDCKLDFGKETFENTTARHDLHIDPDTYRRYKDLFKRPHFDWDIFIKKSLFVLKEKADQLNIKIIDDNLADPCCRKDRKFALTNILKDKPIPQ